MMRFYQWFKQKKDEGRLRTLAEECRWIWGYVWRYRGSVLIHILLSMSGIVMSLLGAIASKLLIDAVIGFNSGALGFAVAMTLGVRLAGIAMNVVATRVGAAIGVRIQHEIQRELFHRILTTDWESLEQFRSGDLLNRIGSDASAVSGAVTGFIPTLLSSTVQFIGAFLIILYYDPVMALITLIGVPVTALASRFLLRKMRNHSREMKELYSDVISFQQEALQNITSVKSFGVMDDFDKSMHHVQDRYKTEHLSFSRFAAWTAALMNLLSLLAYVCCFGWGVYRLWLGHISYGDMTMFLQLSGMLGSAFSSIIGLVPNGISVSTSARRIMTIADLPQEDTRLPDSFLQEKEYTLQLSDVNFHYQGGEAVLQRVNLQARPGELIALSGPSGEGKTTLLRMVLGLIRPSEGTACLVGSSGKSYPLSAGTRRIFGYVPQGNQIFSGTIAENLRLTNHSATDEQLIEALKIACAYDFVMEFPEGLNHVIGGRDKRLSEGQAQRLAVARALLRGAPILLLDEATSALDMELEERLLENLMNSGMVKTCILVTHRPAGKKLCSRQYYIQNGIVKEEAVPQEQIREAVR